MQMPAPKTRNAGQAKPATGTPPGPVWLNPENEISAPEIGNAA